MALDKSVYGNAIAWGLVLLQGLSGFGLSRSADAATVNSSQSSQLVVGQVSEQSGQPSARQTVQPSARETVQPSARQTVQPMVESRVNSRVNFRVNSTVARSTGQRMTKKQEPMQNSGDRAACPGQLQTLVPLMLRDLPSYTNRVTQRASGLYRNQRRAGYVLLAGRPEYEPLSLRSGEFTSDETADPAQVFFTTLERQYVNGKIVEIQHFHWLFLAKAPDRWYFVLMQSSLAGAANHPANSQEQPPTPPEDSSEGAIAQAIRLWLRDCAAGTISLD